MVWHAHCIPPAPAHRGMYFAFRKRRTVFSRERVSSLSRSRSSDVPIINRCRRRRSSHLISLADRIDAESVFGNDDVRHVRAPSGKAGFRAFQPAVNVGELVSKNNTPSTPNVHRRQVRFNNIISLNDVVCACCAFPSVPRDSRLINNSRTHSYSNNARLKSLD